jgi:hypothetical protein
MTHYTLLVMGDDWENQLAPYDEDLRAIPYKDHLGKEEEQRMRDYYLKDEAPEIMLVTEMDIRNYLINKMESWRGNEGGFDKDGLFSWCTYNPNSKWDWYQMGGRWAGFFLLKPEAAGEGQLGEDGVFGYREGVVDNDRRVDQARKGDIDWKGMEAEQLETAKRNWEEGNKLEVGDIASRFFQYGIEKDETEESYMARRKGLSTHAILHFGQWIERGEMGWFATIVGEEINEDDWQAQWTALLASLPNDTLLTLVDCHI